MNNDLVYRAHHFGSSRDLCSLQADLKFTSSLLMGTAVIRSVQIRATTCLHSEMEQQALPATTLTETVPVYREVECIASRSTTALTVASINTVGTPDTHHSSFKDFNCQMITLQPAVSVIK